jgi:hypothetical protein
MRLLVILTFLLFAVGNIATVEAGGPWSDQYCNIKTETVITKDTSGNVIDSKTIEKVVCEDGVKDFLHGAGIAKNCQYFTWKMPYKGTMIDQRSIACEKIDGGWEIVPGYHYIK